jgi:hypothetical protein
MSDHDMTERMADVLVAKVREMIEGFPGSDDERASILAKVSTKLTKIAQGNE